MKSKPDNLASEFFEKILWKIFEDYLQIINGVIKGKIGLLAQAFDIPSGELP